MPIEKMRTILEKSMRREGMSFEDAVLLLSLDPDSSDAHILRRAAHEASLSWTGGAGSVWFAIGLDSAPCPNNCSFCSFGEKWGLAEESWRLDADEILSLIRAHDIPGVGYITLRTTENFPIEELLRIARRVKLLRHAQLVANIGDFSTDTANHLHEAGFRMIYHALRLREGVDTGIDPAQRLRTMHAVQMSPLELAALADPIGPEHSAEEIARSLFVHKEAGAIVSGAMSRVSVPGTPKYDLSMISPARLAQITAVSRLAAGSQVHSICAHPPDAGVVQSGANIIVVDSGAIPRDTVRPKHEWRSFTVEDALALLVQAGYHV